MSTPGFSSGDLTAPPSANPAAPTAGSPSPSALRTRHDIWKLMPPDNSPWHPHVLAYAKAVHALKTATTPVQLTWSHHTRVHGQLGVGPTETIYNQCQHSSWFFLPWHRIYLSVFEDIIRSLIAGMPDVADDVKQSWALPYWDYDRNDSRKLPPAFRAKTAPGIPGPNPLFEASRAPNTNAGVAFDPSITTAKFWAKATRFAATGPAGTSFAGPRTGFNHQGGPIGELEGTPHGTIHNAVGGIMMDFNTAAGDPIFWLHHSNIDRLWEVWRTSTGVGKDAKDTPYLGQTFWFLDRTGARVSHTPTDVVDTKKLGYIYEDISYPASAGKPRAPRRLGLMAEAPEEGPTEPDAAAEPQRIGALDSPVTLSGRQPASFGFALEPTPQAASGAGTVGFAAAPGAARRIIVVLEHITAKNPAGQVYGFFVDPEGDGDPVHVGNLPLFGLSESNTADSDHEVSYSFDITDVVDDLRDAGTWDPSQAKFSLRIINDTDPENTAPTVSIGSISVYTE